MNIAGSIDLKEFERQCKSRKRRSQIFEKREQEVIKPLDTTMKYVSIKEYAEILGVSYTTAYALCAGGALEGAVKAKGSWRIPVKKGAV